MASGPCSRCGCQSSGAMSLNLSSARWLPGWRSAVSPGLQRLSRRPSPLPSLPRCAGVCRTLGRWTRHNLAGPAAGPRSVRLRPPAGGSIRGRLSAGVQARLQRASFHLRRRFARGLGSAPWSGWLRRRRQETPIRISTLGEDRCPYCLDLVDPRDRRGVKLCPVCHTPHHADCWSITGMCQMPHLYGEAHATRTGAAR